MTVADYLKILVVGRRSDLTNLAPWFNSSNHSIDVITKNCFGDYDTVACVRGATLCFLDLFTLVLCVVRIVTLHLAGGRSTIYCNYIVFFSLSSLQCMLGTAEWIFGWTMHASIACQYLRALQLIVLCYTYNNMAFRLLKRPESLTARFSAALLSLCLVYFTFFLIFAFLFQNAPWVDCYANYWLFFTGGHLLLVQIIVFSSLLIFSRIKTITLDPKLQRFRRRGLLLLIGAFEISASSNFLYQLMVEIFANEEISCSGLFNHKQWPYTAARMAYEICVVLLPIWVTFYVFMPLQKFGFDTERLISSSSSASRSILRNPAVLQRRRQNSSLARNPDGRLVDEGADGPLSPPSYDPLFDELGDDEPSDRRRPFTLRRRMRPMGAGRPYRQLKRSKKCRSAPSLSKHVATPTLETIPEEASGGSGLNSEASSPPKSAPTESSMRHVEKDERSPTNSPSYSSMFYGQALF